MAINKETGETIADSIFCVKCNDTRRNAETGEIEMRQEGTKKLPFQIPFDGEKGEGPIKRRHQCRFAYVALGLLLLSFIAPALAVICLAILGNVKHKIFHFNEGTHVTVYHRLFFSQFCPICQSKKRMNLIEKLQDKRGSQVARQRINYIKTIAAAT